jgi:hypothetical protein
MHRELEKKVEIMSKKTEFLEEEDRWELKEEDVKQTLDDVLNEVYELWEWAITPRFSLDRSVKDQMQDRQYG